MLNCFSYNIITLSMSVGLFLLMSIVAEEKLAEPLIQSINVTKNVIRVTANQGFADTYLIEDFFAEYDADENLDLRTLDYSIVTIPFIMNVITVVWASDKNYTIVVMDEDLYYSLKKIKKVFQRFYRSLSWAGELVPQKLVKNYPARQPVAGRFLEFATLFSGGLDSVHTCLRYMDKRQLLTTVWGSDVNINKLPMWRRVKEKCEQFAKTYDHDHTWVRSNLRRFLNSCYLNTLTPEITRWCGCTLQGLGYTGLVAPLLLTHGLNYLLIASSRSEESPFLYGTHPLIDNNISCAGITVYHDGGEFNRIEKLEDIIVQRSKYHKPKPSLRVCWGNDPRGGNCCKCNKCLLTINGLVVLGEKPRDFGFCIDIDQVISRTKNLFSSMISLNHGAHWKHVQEKIRYDLNKKIRVKLKNSYQLEEYFAWFSALNFDEWIPPKHSNALEDKAPLSELWIKAIQHSRDSVRRNIYHCKQYDLLDINLS